MKRENLTSTLSCVVIDLNTQRDFFEAGGAAPVIDVRTAHRQVRRVVAWVKRNQVPVISTLDMNRSRSNSPADPPSQSDKIKAKLECTLLPNRLFVAGDNTLSIPMDLFSRHQQIIFPQRTSDLFANPKADRFITQLKVQEFIVMGAAAEQEIKAVVLGMIARNKRVTLVSDLCVTWNPAERELSLRQMEAKGACVTTTDELLARKLPRRWRYTTDSLVSSYRPIGYRNPKLTLPRNGQQAATPPRNGLPIR